MLLQHATDGTRDGGGRGACAPVRGRVGLPVRHQRRHGARAARPPGGGGLLGRQRPARQGRPAGAAGRPPLPVQGPDRRAAEPGGPLPGRARQPRFPRLRRLSVGEHARRHAATYRAPCSMPAGSAGAPWSRSTASGRRSAPSRWSGTARGSGWGRRAPRRSGGPPRACRSQPRPCPGGVVSMHWDWICERLTPDRTDALADSTAHALDMANADPLTADCVRNPGCGRAASTARRPRPTTRSARTSGSLTRPLLPATPIAGVPVRPASCGGSRGGAATGARSPRSR